MQITRFFLIGMLVMLLPGATLLAQEETVLLEVTFEDSGLPLPIGTDMTITGMWDTQINEAANNHYLSIHGVDETAAFFLSKGLAWTDYSFSADIRFQNGAIYLDSRASDALCGGYRITLDADQNYIGLAILEQQGEACTTGTILQERKNFAPDWSAWFNVRLRVVGDSLSVFLNDDPILSRQDSTFTAGSVRFSPALETNVDIDNIRAVDLSSDTVIVHPPNLTHYDQSSEMALAELQSLELVPEGGKMLFEGQEATKAGSGAWYTALDRQRVYSDVVIAGEFMMTPDSVSTIISEEYADYEFCGFIVRIAECNCGNEDALGYLEAGITNQGTILAAQQLRGETEYDLYISDVRPTDFSQTHHILLVVIDENLSLFIDGERIFDHLEVEEGTGLIAFGMTGATANSTCEATDIWAYSFD